MDKLKLLIHCEKLKDNYKMNDRDFTRIRKLSFGEILGFISSFLKKSLSIEIDNYTQFLSQKKEKKEALNFTSSAFVQQRKKINPAVFTHLSEAILEGIYTPDNQNLKTLLGFRILAVDGSKITLPQTKELEKYFGVSSNQTETTVVQALGSVLYDVLNRFVLDASLNPLSMGEREIALLHFDKLTSSDLVIYDRGYPSYDFVLQHITTGINCLIRVKKDFNNPVKELVSSNKNSQVVLIYPKEKQSFLGKNYDKNTPIKVRLIRVELDNGEVEILMTTLLCSKKYPTKEFKKLYFLRWKIETFYDEIKNKLKVEFFSGYSEIVIRQDFNCAIFLSNLQSAFLHDLEPDIEQINQEKREKNQYEININTNLSYGFLRNRILLLLTKNQPTDVIIEELEKLFLAHTIPIRPNRSNPRNMDKYNRRKRPKVLKNQRDAI